MDIVKTLKISRVIFYWYLEFAKQSLKEQKQQPEKTGKRKKIMDIKKEELSYGKKLNMK